MHVPVRRRKSELLCIVPLTCQSDANRGTRPTERNIASVNANLINGFYSQIKSKLVIGKDLIVPGTLDAMCEKILNVYLSWVPVFVIRYMLMSTPAIEIVPIVN